MSLRKKRSKPLRREINKLDKNSRIKGMTYCKDDNVSKTMVGVTTQNLIGFCIKIRNLKLEFHLQTWVTFVRSRQSMQLDLTIPFCSRSICPSIFIRKYLLSWHNDAVRRIICNNSSWHSGRWIKEYIDNEITLKNDYLFNYPWLSTWSLIWL